MDPSVQREVAALPGAGIVTPLRMTPMDLPRRKNVAGPRRRASTPRSIRERRPLEDPRRHARCGVHRRRAGRRDDLAVAMRAASESTPATRSPLRGPRATRRARVAGLVDAVSGLPSMFVSLTTMRDVYGVTADAQLLIKARPGTDPAAFVATVDRLLARRHPELETLSSAEIKDRIATEINRQFGLFNAILYVAIIVSLLGVVNTLAMSVAERTREIGLLRALGASRWLVRLSMLDESLLITTSGAFAGIGLGLVIAWSWVHEPRLLHARHRVPPAGVRDRLDRDRRGAARRDRRGAARAARGAPRRDRRARLRVTGDDDRGAGEPPGAQVGERVVRRLERIAVDVRRDRHLRRQREELLGVGTRQVGDRAQRALLPQVRIGK